MGGGRKITQKKEKKCLIPIKRNIFKKTTSTGKLKITDPWE